MEDQVNAVETNTEITGMGDSPAQASPQVNVENPQAQGQPANDGYNPKWYEQDGRFGKIWKKETFTDDLAKSYYNLEKQYKPMAEQYKHYNSTFKELGIEPAKLPEIYKEYQTLKDPNHPNNQKASYLDRWLNDPIHKTDVENFFQQKEMAELQRQFPNMNREQIEKQMELEEKVNRFESERQKQEDEKYLQSFTSQLTQQTEKNRKLAESVGFVYSDEIHKAVMEAVAKHDQEYGYPMTAHEAFLQLYGEQIETARTQKLEADFLKRQQAKGNSGGPARNGKPTSPTMSLVDKFRQTLNTK